MHTRMIGVAIVAMAGAAGATVSDIAGFVDSPRTYNDFPSSTLNFMSTYANPDASVSFHESDYGSGNFANRHMAWFGDGGGSQVDFDYGDAFDASMVMTVTKADNVGNVEAGFQADLFGFGLFGVLTGSGEVAAFGSTMPFHSFGGGIYTIGDEIGLRMIYRPGAGEGDILNPSTIEYMYNNMTTGSGWVTSGQIDYTNAEGGIPSGFNQYFGVGAQINQPDATTGVASVNYDKINVVVPAPGAMAMIGFGLLSTRRRR